MINSVEVWVPILVNFIFSKYIFYTFFLYNVLKVLILITSRVMSHCLIGSEIYEKVCKFCIDMYQNGNTTPYLLAYIIDLCDEMVQLNFNSSFFTIALALQVRYT